MMVVVYKCWCSQKPDPDPAHLPGGDQGTTNQKRVDDQEPGMTDTHMAPDHILYLVKKQYFN